MELLAYKFVHSDGAYHTLLRHMAASTKKFVTSMKGMAKRMTSIRPEKADKQKLDRI